MTRARTYSIILVLVFGAQFLQSQDALFSQLQNSRNLLNPALLTIQNNLAELDLNFREQGGSVSSGLPIRTFQVLANFSHQSFKVDKISYGVSVLNDRGGKGHVGSSLAHLHVGYLKKLTGAYSKIGEHHIGIGTSLGGGQKSVDGSRFWFGNQFNEEYNFIEEEKDAREEVLLAEASARSPLFYNIDAGITWYANFNESFSANAGFSMFHLNTANISLIDGQVEQQRVRYALHFGTVNTLTDLITVLPKVQFVRQGSSNLLIIGSEVGVDNKDSNEFALRFGVFARAASSLDNIGLEAILITLNTEYNQFRFGLGYDLTVSSLSRYNNSRGAWEFKLGYAFSGKEKSGYKLKSSNFRM